MDASDIRELHFQRSDDEEYEYQDQQEDPDNIARLDAGDLAGLMSDESPDFVPPTFLSEEQAAEKRAERDRKRAEKEQKRLEKEQKKAERDQVKLEKDQKRAEKEQLRLDKEKRQKEAADKEQSRTTYQRFFLDSEDEDGPPPPRGAPNSSQGPPGSSQIPFSDAPEIDRMEEPQKRTKSSNPRPPKRPRPNDYVSASTAKSRRQPQQQILDFGNTKGKKNKDNQMLSAVRAMARSTKAMFKSRAANGAQKRMLSSRRASTFREERHWLDDGGGGMGDGTGGGGRARRSGGGGGGGGRSRDQSTLSWSREGGSRASGGGGGGGGSSGGGGSGSRASMSRADEITRSRDLTKSRARESGYRRLPRIRDKRAGPLEHMRRAAWQQIQELKMNSHRHGGHVSNPGHVHTDHVNRPSEFSNEHVTNRPINSGSGRKGSRRSGHGSGAPSRNGYINKYGVRVLPSDKVVQNVNVRKSGRSGVHHSAPGVDYHLLEASQSAPRFSERETGEYAFRRHSAGRTGARRLEPEPEQVNDFVGLTEMIEGGNESETVVVDDNGDIDDPIDMDMSPAPESTLDPVHVDFARRVSEQDTFETTFGLANKSYSLEPVFFGRLENVLESWMCPVSQTMVTLKDAKMIFTKVLSVMEDMQRREDVCEALRLVFSHKKQDSAVLEEFKDKIMGLDVGDFSDLVISLINLRSPPAGETLISTDKLYNAVKDHTRPLLVEAAMMRKDKIFVPQLSDPIASLELAWRSLFVAKAIGRDDSDIMLKLLNILPPTIMHEDRDTEQVDIERYKKILLMRTQLLWRFSGEAILWWAKNTPYPTTDIPDLDLEALAPGDQFFTVAKMVSDVYKSGLYGPASDVSIGLVSGIGLRFPRDQGFHRNKLRKLAQTYIYLMLRVRDMYDPELRPSFDQLQNTVHTDKAHLEVIKIEFAAARQTLKMVRGPGFNETDRQNVLKWLDQMIQMTTKEYTSLVKTRLAGEYENMLIQLFEQVDEAGPSVIELLTLPRGSWQKMSEPMNKALIKLVQKTEELERPLTRAFAKFVSRHGPRYYKELAKLHVPPRSYDMPLEAFWMTVSIEEGTDVHPIDVSFVAVKSMLLKKTYEPLWDHVVELKGVDLKGLSHDMILQKIMLSTTSGHLAGQLLDFIRENLNKFDQESKQLIQKLVSYLKGNENTDGAPQLEWFLNPLNFELQADSAQLALYLSMLERAEHESEIKNYLLGSLSISLILDGGQVFFESVKGMGFNHPTHVSALVQLFESLVYSRKHATVLLLPLLLRLVTYIGNDELWTQLWYHSYVRAKTISLVSMTTLENAYLTAFVHLTSLISVDDSTSVLLDILAVPHSTTNVAPSLTRHMDRDLDATLDRLYETDGKWTRILAGSVDTISLKFITEGNMTKPYDSVIQCLASTIIYEPRLEPRLNFLASENPWIGRYLEQHYFQAPQITTVDDLFF